MTNTNLQPVGIKGISQFLSSDNIKAKFREVIGERSQSFLAAVLTAVSQNELLKNATPESIYASALMAATLDLPINPNLGFAYLIPYNNRKNNTQECQFQIGYKGFIQLAMRSGQFKNISASPIYEGQLIESNPLTGYKFDFNAKTSDKITGYAAYFSLLNGFEKVVYMTVEELQKHGKKFSQTFKKGYGLWNDDFDSMALKTVLKLTLAKYAPLSIEMQKALITDQSVIKDGETLDVEYMDNTPLSIDEVNQEAENKRLANFIETAKTIEDLEKIETHIDPHDDTNTITILFNAKKKELK